MRTTGLKKLGYLPKIILNSKDDKPGTTCLRLFNAVWVRKQTKKTLIFLTLFLSDIFNFVNYFNTPSILLLAHWYLI